MPDYVAQQVDAVVAQQVPRRGAGVGEIVLGRVLRTGSRPATATAIFYDIIALDNNFAPQNLADVVAFSNGGRPVYPLLANVAVPSGLALSPGTIVAVRCLAPRMVPGPYHETLAGEHDVCTVLTGNAVLISVGSGDAAMFDWGVLAD